MNRLLPRPMPAPCRQDPDAWFPEGTGMATHQQLQQAKAVCRTLCTLRATCLDLAMRTEQGKTAGYRYGVYGGLTPAERADLDPTVVKPKRARQPAQALAA